MHIGKVVFWNEERLFGFLEERIPVLSGGFVCQKYYLNQRAICFQMSEKIKIGMVARFNSITFPRKRAGEVPVAVDVEIFDTTEQLETYAAAVSLTEGK